LSQFLFPPLSRRCSPLRVAAIALFSGSLTCSFYPFTSCLPLLFFVSPSDTLSRGLTLPTRNAPFPTCYFSFLALRSWYGVSALSRFLSPPSTPSLAFQYSPVPHPFRAYPVNDLRQSMFWSLCISLAHRCAIAALVPTPIFLNFFFFLYPPFVHYGRAHREPFRFLSPRLAGWRVSFVASRLVRPFFPHPLVLAFHRSRLLPRRPRSTPALQFIPSPDSILSLSFLWRSFPLRRVLN